VAKSNNPLKFSPNVEVALQHLLAPPARGFVAAAPAMRDAYDDLRAHQFAFVAGMQAVVEAALQRFDPTALEGRLGDRSLLHSLLPASRNARLWELFVEHYARIRNDAADDFNTLFGQAFLKAYNEHVDSMQAQRSASHKGT
jgi:FHA domain-containing protein